ncbi:FK506-binding protein 1B [Diplodia seriata]|uniref:peptidylprolyl isomerase n=1 Tax=Diplodia seriata TaxID=420778 RepID=A0A1S8BNB0_9PEZI|nr:FK506-binding protein 1B [Diplodia seriata]
MAVTKQTLAPGNGVDRPRAGDDVTIEYTGYLFDASAAENKGKKFDSSIGRGDFNVKIGIGRVIRGWDDGIIGAGSSEGMSLGEKATLTISSDYGYGANGFPGHIPPNADLVL